jgi:hypothetical protein
MVDLRQYGTPKLRKKLKDYYQASMQSYNMWVEAGCRYDKRESVYYPEECRGMLCGAKTRSGHPCKNDGTSYANGRCKFHGGASKGPRTEAGKRQSAINGKKHLPKSMKALEISISIEVTQ